MPRKIRLTQRRQMLLNGHERATQFVRSEIEPVFKKQYKKLERFLRRSNLRKRLGKLDVADLIKMYHIEGNGPYRVVNDDTGETVPGGEHKKKPEALAHMRALYANVDDVQDKKIAMAKVDLFFKAPSPPKSDDWDDWKKALLIALLLGLFKASKELSDIENVIWTSRGWPSLTFIPENIIEAYQRRIGRPLSDIGDSTIERMKEILVDWYLDDRPFGDLLTEMERLFDDLRINTIAETEVGNVLSQIVFDEMAANGLGFWFWDALGENPCKSDITIVGVTYQGCRELNGHRFPVGHPMPPDAAHPHCKCLPTPDGM